MKKQLKNNEKTTRYLDSLPKIYLIVYWARCGVIGFPYTKKVDKNGVPLVYKYYDGNGTCDLWELCRIDHTITGIILGFTTNEKVAQKLAEGYNKIKEKEITTKTTEFVAPIEERIIFRVKPNLIGDFVNRYCTEKFEWNARAMVYGDYGKCNTWQAYNDSGSASRYFYNAKASVRDREEGLENYIPKYNLGDIELGQSIARKNTHVSVKPTSLMQYLVRLVTPPNCTILDPFNGSGSTGKAVMYENHDRNSNYKYIGIDLSEEYLEISKYRINFVLGTPSEMESVEEVGQSKSKNKKSLWE